MAKPQDAREVASGIETGDTTKHSAPRQSETLSGRTYGQLCPLAIALDRIGDRWTPLILRELFGGPARFSEIAEGLAGIAPNLLTARLRRLEQHGLIERRTSRAETRYSLTPAGASIRPALEALALWGLSVASTDTGNLELTSPRSHAMALQGMLGFGRRLDSSITIGLKIDGAPLTIWAGESDPVVRVGETPKVDGRVTTSADGIRRLIFEGADPADVIVPEPGSETQAEQLVFMLSAGG